MLWPGHAQKGPRCAQECSAAEMPWVHWGQKGPSQSIRNEWVVWVVFSKGDSNGCSSELF